MYLAYSLTPGYQRMLGKGEHIQSPSSRHSLLCTKSAVARNGIIREVMDGNWAPCGPRLNHKVSEETSPLDTGLA
ncbi:hypothetical protein DPMN_128683 [Dreissena polymorpha]|uniref:Uncharacterized protein n=1 Tax=Dreissena polymorpha TaxID=45954 RepID=A0A9D4H7N6_DREPO|nr:hypothetical protein DPMN_128683 [Dreissena polymorpha]